MPQGTLAKNPFSWILVHGLSSRLARVKLGSLTGEISCHKMSLKLFSFVLLILFTRTHCIKGTFGLRQGVGVILKDDQNLKDRDIIELRPGSYEDIPKGIQEGFRGMVSKTIKEQFYGGESDKKEGRSHVGGFIFNDSGTYEPHVWRWMQSRLNVTTVLDVACGLGISTDFFIRQGMRPTCLEGSKEALANQKWSPYLTKYKPTTFQDFIIGPPKQFTASTPFFDAAWSAEFLEHMEEKYLPNVMRAFQQVSSSSSSGAYVSLTTI
jgi:hypothetical protein